MTSIWLTLLTFRIASWSTVHIFSELCVRCTYLPMLLVSKCLVGGYQTSIESAKYCLWFCFLLSPFLNCLLKRTSFPYLLEKQDETRSTTSLSFLIDWNCIDLWCSSPLCPSVTWPRPITRDQYQATFLWWNWNLATWKFTGQLHETGKLRVVPNLLGHPVYFKLD